MKLFNQARKYGRQAAGAVVTVGTSIGYSLANAAVDISTTTATAKTDVETAGGLIIGVVVAIAAIAWIRKVVH